MVLDSCCCLCQGEAVAVNHLLCPFSSSVWKTMLQKCGNSGLEEGSELVDQENNGEEHVNFHQEDSF